MGVLRLLTTAGVAGRTVGAVNRGADSPRKPETRGLRSTFETFLANYVPAGPAANLRSMFARWTSAGRIDLSRTTSLSELLHQMQQNLQQHQAVQDKRYFGMMKAYREGVKAWEKQQAVEERTRYRIADELKLSERTRERLLQEQSAV